MARSFISSRGRVEAEIARALSAELGMIGNLIFVDYQNGADNHNNGWSVRRPLKTLEQAYDLTKDKNNDVVILMASATGTSGTSQYVSTELVWANNLTHLIGMGAAHARNGRCRITHISTFTADDGALFTLSGAACHIEGVNFVDEQSHANRYAVKVTGNQNKFKDVSMLGMIGALAYADAASASLFISAGKENTFEGCWIGNDTVTRSAANANVRMRSAATRNEFIDCRFLSFGSGGTQYFIDSNATSALDRNTLFRGCNFINAPTGTIGAGTTMATAVKMATDSGGIIVFDPTCSFTGVTKIDADATGKVFVSGAVPTGATSNVAASAA